MEDSFMRSYVELLPGPDELSNIVYWSQEVLNEIDSRHLKAAYTNTHAYYRQLHRHLTEQEGSPYRGKNSLPYEEFLWALTTVSCRHIVMHEQN
jgi:hypothetical protein